jgi:hypothetical protein
MNISKNFENRFSKFLLVSLSSIKICLECKYVRVHIMVLYPVFSKIALVHIPCGTEFPEN